jgi:hypothetical protein
VLSADDKKSVGFRGVLMYKKAGLVLLIIAVMVFGAACGSFKKTEYKAPVVKDSLDTPLIGDGSVESEEKPLDVEAGEVDDALDVSDEDNESSSIDEVDTLVDDSAKVGSGDGNEITGEEIVETASLDSGSSDIPSITVREGELVKVNVSARDADGDELSFIFGAPLNYKGEWQTKKGDAGEYFATIKVSDGKTSTSGRVRLVVKANNHAPILKNIADITVEEGALVVLPIDASDPDGDKLTITIDGWMSDRTKKTSNNDQGEHSVFIEVFDGTAVARQEVIVTVLDANRAPVIDGIFPTAG